MRRAQGSGGLRSGWPPLEMFEAQFKYFIELPTVIALVEAEKAKLAAGWPWELAPYTGMGFCETAKCSYLLTCWRCDCGEVTERNRLSACVSSCSSKMTKWCVPLPVYVWRCGTPLTRAPTRKRLCHSRVTEAVPLEGSFIQRYQAQLATDPAVRRVLEVSRGCAFLQKSCTLEASG